MNFNQTLNNLTFESLVKCDLCYTVEFRILLSVYKKYDILIR